MREPSGPPPASELLPVLRKRRVEARIADAELIRDHPPYPDRDDAGRRHVREAMMELAVGRITATEHDEILCILSFAVESMKQEAAMHEREATDVPLTPHER